MGAGTSVGWGTRNSVLTNLLSLSLSYTFIYIYIYIFFFIFALSSCVIGPAWKGRLQFGRLFAEAYRHVAGVS